MTSTRSMGSHQSARAKTTTWLTPPHIVEALGPFDLDPCAAPSPRPWATAERHIELAEDGLEADWGGDRVWLNPPYSFEAWKWLDKLADHGRGTALIFARTETAGFVRTVWERATAILFVHGRLHFHYPDGTRAAANSGAPSCLVAYGELDAARLAGMASQWGSFVSLDRVTNADEISLYHRIETVVVDRFNVHSVGLSEAITDALLDRETSPASTSNHEGDPES